MSRRIVVLPEPLGPEHGHELAVPDAEVDVVQHFDAAVGLGDAFSSTSVLGASSPAARAPPRSLGEGGRRANPSGDRPASHRLTASP